jgi:hypothetical protein
MRKIIAALAALAILAILLFARSAYAPEQKGAPPKSISKGRLAHMAILFKNGHIEEIDYNGDAAGVTLYNIFEDLTRSGEKPEFKRYFYRVGASDPHDCSLVIDLGQVVSLRNEPKPESP